MCVAFFTLEHHDYALILCSNRDEYLSRPTEFAHFHSFETQGHLRHGILQDQQPGQCPTQHSQYSDTVVLSGIDVQAGGTWLGLAKTGKLALLTNITEDTALKFPQSRGHLVASFLANPPSSLTDLTDIEQYLRGLVGPFDLTDEGGARYAGFNLLLLSPRVTCSSASPSPLISYEAYLATNRGASGQITYRPLTHVERQYGGLSNGSDGYGGKEWIKVKKGLEILRTVVKGPDHSEDKIIEELFELLTWTSPTPPTSRAELCNTIQVDPILFRPGNIGAGYYATRLATVILVKRTGEVVFIERDRWMLPDEAKSNAERKQGSEWSGDRSRQGEERGERKPVLASTLSSATQRVYRFKLDM
ncbi:NRDE protein-domain-containing protein [Pisolithus orientalis]|uniref:NRDE protein-domain-containing protein n=1 Tax=Pisolithus orientalis TaxID=936130 RepID=UPI002225A2CD|nr:NRDE protein-domain-containing protein [Pisolithus orientalis]KAI6030438.1 NRDE protein-domain-containing protein [Pisolithus orientalis]